MIKLSEEITVRQDGKKKVLVKMLDYIILKNINSTNYLYGIMKAIKTKYAIGISTGSIQDSLRRLERNGFLTSKMKRGMEEDKKIESGSYYRARKIRRIKHKDKRVFAYWI